MALNLLQQPGLITFDTKLDLQFDPGGFLSRSLSLWNDDSAIGGLQNQASGYLFPMGPAFLLGDVLGMPMWLWERLWSAAVMLVAYGGARRLASHWPGISGWGAVLAGLTYMLAPRVLTTVGSLSGETLPAAVLPWTVLPLVLYLRGRMRWRVAALCSAATIPWMGGQNATLVLACLLLPGLLLALAEGRAWRRRVRDVVSWMGLVVLACLWWLIPLFLLGGYGPPFLDFIESARNTAGATGWLASLRGTSHWVAFFPGGGSAGWTGGYALASSSVLLFTTVAVAGAGLLGLALADLWQRKVLIVALVVGIAVLTAGSGGWTGSPLSGLWLDALDTWLAPLRNVHKFDPLVRLPLSLGVGAFVSVGLPRLVALSRRVSGSARRPVLAALTVLVAVVVGAAAQPAASGQLRAEGGMEDIPSSWRQAVEFLNGQSGPVSALVLPESGFAVQQWGRTVDEPIQVLDAPPWVARALVTVAPAGTLRLLDSVDRQVAEGRPRVGLAESLSRLGVTHVVLRNDLDPERTDVPSSDALYASLLGDDDLHAVARYGRTSSGLPAVEIYAVGATGGDPRVSVADWADRAVVQGGPEVVNDLVAAGLVGEVQATALATGAPGETADVITDSNRRVERSFGRVNANVSGVMTANEPFRLERRVHDYTGDPLPEDMTTAEYDGAELIHASSSAGYADALGPMRPEEHPYAAFDASVFTAWVTEPLTAPEGQWVEVRFDRPVDPGLVNLHFDVDNGARVETVLLTTDQGSRTVPVGIDGRATGVDTPGDRTSRVRMEVVDTSGSNRRVRLADLSMSGHRVRRSLRLPGEVTAGSAVFLSAEAPARACLVAGTGVACDQDWQRETPETAGFDRTFEVSEAGEWRLAGQAVATHGLAPQQLLAPLSDEQVSVTATSTFAGDPAVAPANAYDGRAGTGWYASPLDPAPGLQLRWKERRVITGLDAVLSEDQPGHLPPVLVVDPLTPGEEAQLVATTGPRAGVMTPVRTSQLRIRALQESRSGGVGISELEIEGLADLQHAPDPASPTGVVCGFGPTIEVDGNALQTRLSGSLEDVGAGAPLQLETCGAEDVRLEAGTHRVRVTNPAGFAVSHLWLQPAGTSSPASEATSPTSEVTSWSPTERTVEVRADDDVALSLAQSYNRGWQATSGGVRLDPVVVDGWKQGWHVPAGTTGPINLRFAPQSGFTLGIVLGLALAALLGVAALTSLWVARRRPDRLRGTDKPLCVSVRAPVIPPRMRVFGLVAGGAVCALVSVPLLAGALAGRATRRTAFASLSAAVAALLLLAVLIAIADPGPVLAPPATADAVAALVVGVIVGRVFSGHDAPEGGPA